MHVSHMCHVYVRGFVLAFWTWKGSPVSLHLQALLPGNQEQGPMVLLLHLFHELVNSLKTLAVFSGKLCAETRCQHFVASHRLMGDVILRGRCVIPRGTLYFLFPHLLPRPVHLPMVVWLPRR